MKDVREFIQERAPKMSRPKATGFDAQADLFQFIATNLNQSLTAKEVKTSDMYFKHYKNKSVVVHSGADKATIRKGDLKNFQNVDSLDDVEKALEGAGLKKK